MCFFSPLHKFHLAVMEITQDSGVWDPISNPITEANNYLHFCFLPVIVPLTRLSSVNRIFPMKWAFFNVIYR